MASMLSSGPAMSMLRVEMARAIKDARPSSILARRAISDHEPSSLSGPPKLSDDRQDVPTSRIGITVHR